MPVLSEKLFDVSAGKIVRSLTICWVEYKCHI